MLTVIVNWVKTPSTFCQLISNYIFVFNLQYTFCHAFLSYFAVAFKFAFEKLFERVTSAS